MPSSHSYVAMMVAAAALVSVSGAACNQSTPTPAPAPAPVTAPAKPAEEPYTPGLGEIMTLQQMRHTKLWLAGQANNWDLADYEIKELGEGFDDVVKFHPTHEDAPVAPKDAVPRMVTQPVKDLQDAITKKDKKAFEVGYDALTKACNDCHSAMNFGFNVVQRPTSNPYPNQVFAPRK